MMQKNSDGIYTSSLLSNLGVLHGYSSRRFGDLRQKGNQENFLGTLGLTSENLIIGQQIHGIRIARVKNNDKNRVLTDIDGLVAKKEDSLQGVPLQNLGVTFADCVPILAVDPRAEVIGTAHAGWKGTLSGIASELISAMTNAGAEVQNIYVSIGPHIGMCCYNVYEDRALAFQKQFGADGKITSKIDGQWHLDIGYVNYLLLQEAGVNRDHIDAPVMCTSCQVSEFNSFRKDPKDQFGVQLGVVAL